MKQYLSFFFIYLSSLGLGAQVITGSVVDQNNEAIAYADVVLKNAGDSAIAKVGYTEQDGKFVIPSIAPGRYFVEVYYVGFDDYIGKGFDLTDQTMDLGTLMLNDASSELEEVTVTAKKPLVEVLPDRTKFNVRESINAQGSDAFELLRKAPGVVVDNNDNIALMGKNGVQIYINGRPSPLGGDDLVSFLKGLSSDDIESIDIITNPGARFEAEGNAGIIDIRLRKNENEGANATINLGFMQGITPKGTASLAANYRNEAFNIFGNYSYRKGIHHNWANFYREQVGNIYVANNTFKRNVENHNARVGMDYTFNSKHSLGTIVSLHYNQPVLNTKTITRISDEDSGEVLKYLFSANEGKDEVRNLDYNINYSYTPEKGKSLNLDLDYGRFDRASESFQPNAYWNANLDQLIEQNDYRAITPIDVNIYSVKLDYESPLGAGKMTTGVKSRRVITDNTYAFYEVGENGDALDMGRSNNFVYDEWVNALYGEYQQRSGKWSWQVGVRAEYTLSEGVLSDLEDQVLKTTPRDYLDIFPSAGISYTPVPQHSWGLNYSRRIDRPNYQDLNPFEFKMSELSYRKGNAFLNPQYTHSLKLTHTFNFRFSTSLSYSYVDDFFAQITDTINQEASFIMTDNLAKQQVYNLNFSLPFSIKQWWNVYFNLNGGYLINKANYGEGRIVDLSVPTFSMYGQTSFLLPKGWGLELSGWYNAGGLWGGIFENEPMGGLDAGVQYKFPNDRGSVKFSMGDLLNTMTWGGKSNFGAQYVKASGGWESRAYRINLTYTLGNKKIKKTLNRKTGIDEEKGRLNENDGRGNG